MYYVMLLTIINVTNGDWEVLFYGEKGFYV